MKNVWIIDHYASEPKYGAYARQYYFAVGLSELGYNVTVFTSSFSHFKHEYYSDNKEFMNAINERARFVYIRTQDYNNNSSPKRFIGMAQIRAHMKSKAMFYAGQYGKPDYVVGSSPHPFVWQAASYLARKFKGSFIAEVRDFWPLELRNGNESMAKKVFFKYLESVEAKAFRDAYRIVCTAPYGDKYVCDELGIDRRKYCSIGQPLNCEEFDRTATQFVGDLPDEIMRFMKNRFVCVFAGYYMAYEGVYEMLEAARELRQKYTSIGFVFCGSGDEEEGMRKYAKEHGLDNVLIYSRINKELIPALLKASDVCLAYLVDNSGNEMFKYGLSKNKLNEYMYSGRPIVMGYDYDNNEINDSGSGFTFMTKHNEFAQLVERIYLMTVEERERMGRDGRKYMIQHHDIKVLSEKYAEMLE